MKKILATTIAVAMLFCLSVQSAFAVENPTIGEVYEVTEEFTDRKGEIVDFGWTTGDYKVTARYTTGAKYVEQPYIDDDSNTICIKVRPSTSLTTTQTIKGTVTVVDEQVRGERYTATVEFRVSPPQALNIVEVGTREFVLPGSYNYGVVRFRDADTKATYGMLNAEFISEVDSRTLAYYDVKISDQGNLILSHNENAVTNVLRKYEEAYLEFITFSATPKFDIAGTMGIVMESDEFLYKRSDETLTAVNGKYNDDRGTFDFKTDTLGAYVISDRKLSGTGAASSTAPEASSSSVVVTPPPASSSKPVAPPASSSKPVAPPASSVAPPPSSSSIIPESSSVESSSEPAPEPVPSSSEPEPSSSSTATVPDEDEGGFPILPVAIGLGVVVIGGAAVFFIFRNNSGKKNYDSWDD